MANNDRSGFHSIYLAALALSFACGSSHGVAFAGTTAQQDNPVTPERRDGDSDSSSPVAEATDDVPAHRFVATAHPPRHRPGATRVDFAALPPMIERSSSCYGERRVARPKPIPSRPVEPMSKRRSRSSASSAPPADAGGYGAGPAESSATLPSHGPSGAGPVPTSPSADVPTMSPSARPSPGFGRAKKPDRRESARRRPAHPSAAIPDQEQVAEVSHESAAVGPLAPVYDDRGDDDELDGWGAAVYLSNDDSMSLSSAQRVLFAIDRFLPLPLAHIRPHELLNYFSFETAPVAPTDDFSVTAEIAESPDEPGIYKLAMAVSGRQLDRESRRNTALTLVVDRSGSMASEGRMEYLKMGLRRMQAELKPGDLVNVVLFDHHVCTPLENFVVGRDSPRVLESVLARVQPRGSTDIHAGLTQGYKLADRDFQASHSNRVMLITDALANTGVTDDASIALIGRYYDQRRIRLSGVGVGTEFNDSLLDKLTEQGRGAYVFLGSPAEVDAVFGGRFVSLIETVANDVHFKLHLPPSLRMNVFYGEESSTVKEDVQAIHYFANTSQLFLSDLMARGGELRPQDGVMLSVEYEDPESGVDMVEEFPFTLGEIHRAGPNVRKGALLMTFIDHVAAMAARPVPSSWSAQRESWADAEAFATCESGRDELRRRSSGLTADPEVRRVLGLWDTYCSRYARPRKPIRRTDPATGWPAARGR